ncbi:hypothetical protein HII36_13905 [Nonomuraea sp. NN258]|uniref:sensor histidine kinase n=1 Tax=Nonomuraea antri TaxID=2730852 RepID=UPI001569097A|nr:histidine kinase [Nonomuraea antri]NRQ32928.1 hypothetical protein [Nonomuraea antri]
MDPIKRAGRLTRVMFNSVLAILWLFIIMMSLVGLGEGKLPVWRFVPALIAAIVFSWLYVRMVNAFVERRDAIRDTVAAGVLAVLGSLIGSGEPMGWGFMLVAWSAVAGIGRSRCVGAALCVGVFLAGTALSWFSLATGQSVMSEVRMGDSGTTLVSFTLVYALWAATLLPANRLWAWIWTMAVEAHEGREAHTRLALAEERLRFARDLHDLVGHQLSAIAVKTQLAVRLADADAGAAKSEMAEVNALTRKALRELREAVRGYRELDLTAELHSIKGVLEAAGVRCEVRLPYRDLPAGVAPVFAYVVREAATNVLKHSTASFCEITLRFTDQEAELLVRNDGVSRQQGADLGSGLTGMGERLAAVGGELTARPTGDGEFSLQAVVSLPIRG